MPSTRKDERIIKQLLNLWSDPKFKGSFSGLTNFQNYLHNDPKFRHVTDRQILAAFRRIPQLNFMKNRKSAKEERKYILDGPNRSLMEADIMIMPKERNLCGALIVIGR